MEGAEFLKEKVAHTVYRDALIKNLPRALEQAPSISLTF